MYDIKQFRVSMYAVVLLGITGFALAAESPGLWVFSVAMMVANAWLVSRKQFRPIPRLLANSIAIVALIYTAVIFSSGTGSPILSVGQLLVFLQIVKIWELRANRDYAQLLVLGLLLMVSAAISTASLLFGVLFIAYLFLCLYCCLLFHLKVETDHAKAALAPALANWGESVLRQDQRYLGASMRRLTILVATYAFVAAILVFVFFPRVTGAGVLGQFQWHPKNTLTGFSEQVSFQQVARITQNDEMVGTVKVWTDGILEPYHEPLLLRGVTHDYYKGAGDSSTGSYQWTHAPRSFGEERDEHWAEMMDDSGSGELTPSDQQASAATTARYREEFDLNPTGTPVLFSLAGPVSLKPEDIGNLKRLPLRYAKSDQTIRAGEPITQPIRYMVKATGNLGDVGAPSHQQSNIDPLITQFARRPDVAGQLALQRDAEMAARPDHGMFFVSPLDGQIAAKIEGYLRRNYMYTLDLTNADRIKGRDPMVAFLYDFKRGHCEYFAGAMTLMCQSLGLQSRLVVGFKCDDYNPYGHFYTIRQSQAHAWVEVRTIDGWKSYDPTSGNSDTTIAASAWAKTKRFFDFMEYTWQNSVISYSAENRDSLIQSVDTGLNQTAIHSSNRFENLKAKVASFGDAMASWIVGPMVGLLLVGFVSAVGWFFLERWKLRRRAARIGIVDLPASAQAKLIRQLGFYDDLVRLLERHHILRPPHLTPLEFCDTLSFLPSSAYDTIYRITQLFYRIRYGQAELDDGQQKRLVNVIDRLSRQMPELGNPER